MSTCIHKQSLLGLLAENVSSLARFCVKLHALLIAHVWRSVHCDLAALPWLAHQMLSSAHIDLSYLFRALEAIKWNKSFLKPIQRRPRTKIRTDEHRPTYTKIDNKQPWLVPDNANHRQSASKAHTKHIRNIFRHKCSHTNTQSCLSHVCTYTHKLCSGFLLRIFTPLPDCVWGNLICSLHMCRAQFTVTGRPWPG